MEFLQDFVSALRTTFQAGTDIKDGVINVFKNKKNIREHAKNNIAYFPLIISNSITENTIEMIIKSNERECASMMKVLLTQKEVLVSDPSNPNNDLLKKIGINESAKIEELKQQVNEMYSEEINEIELSKQMLKEWGNINKSINPAIDKDLNMDSLNESTMFYKAHVDLLLEAKKEKPVEVNIQKDIQAGTYQDMTINKGGIGNAINPSSNQSVYNNIQMGGGGKGGKGGDNPLYNYDPSNNQDEFVSIRGGKTTESDERYRKYSEMQPSMFQIELTYTVPGGSVFKSETLFGVKVEPHFVPTEEITANISRLISNKGLLFRFIKWTTREIQFWKDFVFTINTIKQDIYYAKKSDARKVWGDSFKSHGFMNLVRKVMKYNGLIPLTSIAISIDDYNLLKEQQGIDLRNPAVIKNVMKSMYLFNFMIIDENVKKIYMYKEEDAKYVAYTFNYLEKATDQDMNLLKQVLTM